MSDKLLDKWRWTIKKNPDPNIEKAQERKVARALWRRFYHRTAAWTTMMIHSSTTPPQPLSEEPEGIEEFVDVLLANFQAASATNLDALTNFSLIPRSVSAC